MDVPITAYTVVAPGLDFEPIFALNARCHLIDLDDCFCDAVIKIMETNPIVSDD